MSEVSDFCHYHRNALFAAELNGFIIANRAAGLNNAAHTLVPCQFNAITEGEESVRCHYCALQRAVGLFGTGYGMFQSIDATYLSHSGAKHLKCFTSVLASAMSRNIASDGLSVVAMV